MQGDATDVAGEQRMWLVRHETFTGLRFIVLM